jgi:hypothetical protein
MALIMKSIIILIIVNLCIQNPAFAQYYKLEPLKDSDRKKSIQFHYASRSKYAGVELYLFKNGTFRFENYTCLASYYSTGTWTLRNEVITFRSDIRKDDLPVKLVYRQRDSSDKGIKRLADPRDLNGNELRAGIYINTELTACYWGDSYCFGKYEGIDSIQIGINDFRSKWMKVKEGDEIVQAIVQTAEQFGSYVAYDAKFRRSKNKLISIDK